MEFRILGPLEVLHEGGIPIGLGPPRQRAVFARLIVSAGETVTADRLIEDLWPGDIPATARHALHVYVSRLRSALGTDRVRLDRSGGGYRISVAAGELDAARFERLVADGRAALGRGDPEEAEVSIREALDIWRGPPLADFRDEVFAQPEVVRLDEARITAIELRIAATIELGGDSELVGELSDLVGEHPYREVFWEQLMMVLYRCGRQAEALRVYQRARTKLVEDLGIEPGPALRRMEERILVQDPALDRPSTASARTVLRYLPLQRTSFVGRERELAQGAELLSTSRLLTLTGAPGSGKTSLALRLAVDHSDDFPDGIYFVPLADIADARLLGAAIARVIGVREVPGESIVDGVKAYLKDRRVLLILDNFEQILEAAPSVSALLDAAPELRVVVTSRAPLTVSGEQELPVGGLRVPPTDDFCDLDAMADYDAVALFLARCQAADPAFVLNHGNAAAVAEITARLDGLPLALELAAARVKLLSPQELSQRLEKSLPLLTGGPADVDARHRTMRDAIAWSYDLLGNAEQDTFRRLSIFRGGFTLDAASAIAGLSDIDVLKVMESLLRKNLLSRVTNFGASRFRMLEMIREYALEQLHASDLKEETAERHARYFCSLAEATESELTGKDQQAAIAMLSREQDNIRSALQYAVDAPVPDLALLLAGSIWRFWQSSGQLSEGKGWLEAGLKQEGASPSARASGLSGFAGLAYWQGDYEEASARYQEALGLYRAAGDHHLEAETLLGLSMTASLMGDSRAAADLADQALPVFEDLGARDGIGRVHMAQAAAAHRRNEYAEARRLWETALAISRGLGDRQLAVTQLIALAAYSFQDGDVSSALKMALDALDEAMDLRNVQLSVWMLDFVAAFAAPTAPEDAVRLAGAVGSLRQDAGGGMRLGPVDLQDARTVASKILSVERSDRAWLAGQAMTLAQAADYARELVRSVGDGQQPSN